MLLSHTAVNFPSQNLEFDDKWKQDLMDLRCIADFPPNSILNLELSSAVQGLKDLHRLPKHGFIVRKENLPFNQYDEGVIAAG